jgi:rhodanese-related sulfurtransferase
MELISREELKAKLERRDDFKLVMTLGEFAFNAAHIPGSLNVSSMDQLNNMREVLGLVSPDDEIVVYCSNEPCMASQVAYGLLASSGFTNVRRYAGGIQDWIEAGYTYDGSGV